MIIAIQINLSIFPVAALLLFRYAGGLHFGLPPSLPHFIFSLIKSTLGASLRIAAFAVLHILIELNLKATTFRLPHHLRTLYYYPIFVRRSWLDDQFVRFHSLTPTRFLSSCRLMMIVRKGKRRAGSTLQFFKITRVSLLYVLFKSSRGSMFRFP
jgi:hypothetical protein